MGRPIDSGVTWGEGAQWAKLGGQAVQLDVTLHSEDFGWTNPINVSCLWWNESGEGMDWGKSFFERGRRSGWIFGGKLNDIFCFFSFDDVCGQKYLCSYLVTTLIFISLNSAIGKYIMAITLKKVIFNEWKKMSSVLDYLISCLSFGHLAWVF